jgi:hypothetical protein
MSDEPVRRLVQRNLVEHLVKDPSLQRAHPRSRAFEQPDPAVPAVHPGVVVVPEPVVDGALERAHVGHELQLADRQREPARQVADGLQILDVPTVVRHLDCGQRAAYDVRLGAARPQPVERRLHRDEVRELSRPVTRGVPVCREGGLGEYLQPSPRDADRLRCRAGQGRGRGPVGRQEGGGNDPRDVELAVGHVDVSGGTPLTCPAVRVRSCTECVATRAMCCRACR